MRSSLALLFFWFALLPIERLRGQLALETDFSGDRTTGLSGALYFDLEVKLPVELRALDLHLASTSGIVHFYLYLTPDTRVGKLSNPSVWEEALHLEIPVGSGQLTRVDGFRPLRLKPGNYGCAVAVFDSGTRYSDGIGRELVYEDGYLKIECGEATDNLFSGSSSGPAVWNGRFLYGDLEPRGPFLYVHDPDSSNVHGYALDAKTGAPGELFASPFQARGGDLGCGGNCQSLAADPGGAFLFAGTASGLAVLAREPGGLLREVPGSPFAGSGGLLGVGAWRRGRMLRVFAAIDRTARVDVFAVDPETGQAVLQPSSLRLGTGEAGSSSLVGLHVGKRFVYAADQGMRTVHGFAIDSRTGALAPISGSPWNAGPTGLFNLVADARESQLVVNGCTPGTYRVFPIDRRSGTLGLPFERASTSSCNHVLGFAGKRFYGAGNEQTQSGPVAIDLLDRGTWSTFSGAAIGYEFQTGAVQPKGRVLYYVQHDGARSVLIAQSLEKRSGLAGGQGLSLLRGGILRPPTGMVWVAR